MKHFRGKFTDALIYTGEDNIDNSVLEQLKTMLSNKAFEDTTVRIMPDYHVGKGCMIGTTIKLSRHKKRVVPDHIGVDIGCLDKDTEFLTPYGWKKISEYQNDDKVLQYNKETDSANFVNPMNYIVEDCDEFLHFKNNKGLDQMLSSEHKVLVWKGYKSKGYSLEDFRADDLSDLGSKLDKGYYGVKTSFNILNDGIDLTENEIRLDVMISADGSIKYQREKEHQIYLHFKKERKIVRAKELLENNGIEYKETLGKDGSTHIYFFINKKFNKDLSKYWGASKEQLKTLAEESLLWDGHLGYRSFFSSTDKSDADIIQFAFASTDIRAGITEVEYEGKNWKKSYIVTPTKNNIVGITNTVSTVKSVDGKKYCFTVPTGYFIARRNGKMFITGNCGVLVVNLSQKLRKEQIKTLDSNMDSIVKSGFKIWGWQDNPLAEEFELLDSKLRANISKKNVVNSLGTLGGGNHFIEIGYDEKEDAHVLIIHTGSRGYGARIAKYYQEKAYELSKERNMAQVILGLPEYKELYVEGMSLLDFKKSVISKLKSEGNHAKIQDVICQINKEIESYPLDKELAYLDGQKFEDYMHDLQIGQRYAALNRKIIADNITKALEVNGTILCDSIHNYIEKTDDGYIARKGATRANKEEILAIPLNMSDGVIIAKGKGNVEWNCSAPHGAGRVYSRTQARSNIDLQEFRKSMEGIYTTSVDTSTLDEAPQAYKKAEVIISQISDSVDILKIITPVYNFKASE